MWFSYTLNLYYVVKTKGVHRSQGGKCQDISAIYRRYIMYREASTRYFVEKNRRGDIFRKYRRYIGLGRYIGDFLKKSPLVTKYWWYIGDVSEINRRFFCDISPPSCNVIWRPRSHPCWSNGLDVDSNGNMEIQRLDYSQFFIQRPKLIFNGKLMFQQLFWPKFLL